MSKKRKAPPMCPNCGERLIKKTGDYGLYAECEPCDVRSYPREKREWSSPADRELRRLRAAAHAALDWLWKSGRMTRSECYQSLARHLGIETKQCHIALFGKDQCREVVEWRRGCLT